MVRRSSLTVFASSSLEELSITVNSIGSMVHLHNGAATMTQGNLATVRGMIQSSRMAGLSARKITVE